MKLNSEKELDKRESTEVIMLSRKIRLQPTPEQESLFWQSAGVSRWAYNYFLFKNEEHYAEHKKGLTDGVVRKEITQLKKTPEFVWLNDVGSNVVKQSVKDSYNAYKRWFNKVANKPTPKKKYKTKPSFYVNYESLRATQRGFRGEKIGEIKTCEPLPRLKKGCLYSSPRITHDGLYWYLSVSYKEDDLIVDKEVHVLTEEVIGIDVGVKILAYCSNGEVFENINKTKKVKDLEKKFKREQRRLSRKIQDNVSHYIVSKGKDGKNHRKPVYKKPLKECKNIQNQKIIIRKLYSKLTNIRDNYLHQTSYKIVSRNPKKIVMEDLNILGMMKNRHLSKAIANQKLYFFKYLIQYKAKKRGIEFVNANRFYPSTKLCSSCGNKANQVHLSERIYTCEKCGVSLDRDYNASMNLQQYV